MKKNKYYDELNKKVNIETKEIIKQENLVLTSYDEVIDKHKSLSRKNRKNTTTRNKSNVKRYR